jgi:SpoVK/Ycf46/Vps4 family AAA+-type ATPase
MRDLHDLELLLGSAIPIVAIETHEEARVVELFRRAVVRSPKPFYHWTVTDGLRRLDRGVEPPAALREPTDLLLEIKSAREPAIYLLSDFHPYLEDPVHVRLIRDIAQQRLLLGHTVVLVSHAVKIPPELTRSCARFALSVPDRDQLKSIVLEEARTWSRRNSGRNVRTRKQLLDRLVDNLRGLPEHDAKRLARGAIENDGAITEDDLPDVMQAKFELLGREGVLSYEYDTAHFAEVAGLERLKEWLRLREPVFAGSLSRPGLDIPKGILLLGVQGCGKSLAAKAVAGSWGVPLLRLDFGNLYNKYHGETERNLREALGQAETMAPCVLWIDEIEKGLGTDGGDSGTSRRVLGSLLTWMAENDARTFLVATANDIESLPPELLRTGRMDEIFFVDLPDPGTRRSILEIHMDKRELDAGKVDTKALAAACEGFSGAEIEQAVVSALYASHARGRPVDTEALLEEVRATRPLSVVMAERVEALRAWAAQRTVPAN